MQNYSTPPSSFLQGLLKEYLKKRLARIEKIGHLSSTKPYGHSEPPTRHPLERPRFAWCMVRHVIYQ
jgi:hypothetical protein